LRTGLDDQASLEFALAAAGLKHAIPGDFNLAGEADVEAALTPDGLDVRR
jgi:2-dehydro-3-deoxygluconokinase